MKTAQVNEAYLPPLTSELFGPPMETTGRRGETFQGILEEYPGAKSLASQISIRVSGGEPLEKVLGSLKESGEKLIVRDFRQVPLYLQALLGRVSDAYTSEPVNYTHLMYHVLGSAFRRRDSPPAIAVGSRHRRRMP